MYKLIAADLDDTLLTDELTVSPATVDAVKRLAVHGVTFTIATGRMFVSASKFARQLGLTGNIIVYNGAMVMNAETGEIVVNKTMPLPLAQDVLRIAEDNGVGVQIFIEDKCYTGYESEHRSFYHARTGVLPEIVGDPIKFLQVPPTKIMFYAKPEKIKELYDNLGERYSGKLEMTISKPIYLEFVDHSVSKGIALRELAESMNIRREEVMAFGDSYNDISMIEYAGKGVAMANGFERVKNIADYICPTNEEDGVAKTIEKFVLKGT